jgi:UDP-N-acetylmuramyl tripeptide synthase
VIVATNLFRDQLDRYGEADSIVDRWTAALASAAEGSVLVYCADDPRLAMLAAASPLPSFTFGLAGAPSDRDQTAGGGDATADPVACRTCGRQLEYAWRSIGHLGSFSCPSGHIGRVAPDMAIELRTEVSARRVDQGPASRTTLALSGRFGEAIARPALPGLTNAYNVAAAAVAGWVTGHEIEDSAAAMDGYVGPFGRFEWIAIDGRRVLLILVKNTISLAETAHLGRDLPADVVLIALNDAPADGRDVSWMWDAPIADLVTGRAVVLTGTRSDDLCLRLKSDPDVISTPPTSIQQTSSLTAALDVAVARTPPDGLMVVAATYTAMMGLRAIAERRGDAPAAPR